MIKHWSLPKAKFNTRYTRNLPKVLIRALKDKKSSTTIWRKSTFQTITIELYKQSKCKQKNENIRLVIASIGVDVIVKINDEIYVLGIIKIYC